MKCFEFCAKNKIKCVKKECRYWINKSDDQMCCVISAKNDKSMTLEEIGKIFNVTRMRICQIEKRALSKIKNLFAS